MRMKLDEAIKILEQHHMWTGEPQEVIDVRIENKAMKTAIDTMRKYQKMQGCLDKIKAEIIEEKDFAYADFEQYKIECLGVDAEYVEDESPQDDFRYGMERAIEIIDKYKAENEG